VAAGADVIALVDHLGGPAVLIGNSMGAGAAASAAAEAPHLVSGLVLIGPFVRNPPVGFAALLAFRLALLRPWGPAAWRAYYASQYPGRRPADLAEHQARIREYLRRPRYWRAFAATTHTSHQPVEERRGTIHTPTLVVMGDHDRDFRDPAAEARLIADRLDGAVVMIPGAGHYPQAEYPEIVSAAVLNLLTVINAQKQWEESSMYEYFASADYRVLDGRQEEFVAAFVEWFEWTRDEFPAFGSARLMRDTGATLHFVSWSSWKDAASREAWRASDEFARRLERVRALCEELRGADYSLAVAIGEQRAQSEMAA
jgi:quinol monooxygenase YgiN